MKKRIISMLLTVSMVMLGLPLTVFADAVPSEWAVSEIVLAEEANLVTEKIKDDYQKEITREEFCELVVKLYTAITGEVPDTVPANFIDIDNDEISKAYGLGIVYGVAENEFAPYEKITRQEVCTMLVRCIDKAVSGANVHDYPSLSELSSKYDDASQVADWAIPSVSYAIDNDIMKGVYAGLWNTLICPLDNTTREQAVLLIYRVYMNALEIEKMSESAERDNKLYVSKEMYCQIPDEKNIAEKGYTKYVNNEIILHAKSGTERDLVQQLIEKYNGSIVGEISVTDTYQIQFKDNYEYDDLEALIEKISAENIVSWCSMNFAFETDVNYDPQSDKEWENQWGGFPSGTNWGVEAIKAPQAWEYRDFMDFVDVGVFDCCFYEHDDLVYSDLHFNHPEKCKDTHGTHVSGTIAAGFDNGIGITGVVPYVNLYGFSYSFLLERYDLTILHEFAFSQLIVTDGCKVLNFSNNTGKIEAVAASDNYIVGVNAINAVAAEEGRFLKNLLDKGYDFTICVAAGNANDDIYYKYRSKRNPLEIDYSDERDWSRCMGGLYEESILQGNYQAVYNNYLNAITIEEVKDRIVVVGSCNDSYEYSEFSGIGDRVDVMAPGERIYSTIDNDNYGNKKGTSMAAPHVSGVAAMLFAIDPTLSGDKVKQIIVDTATKISGCDYKLLNAEAAVKQVVVTSISGSVVSEDGQPLEGVSVKFSCDDESFTVLTDSTGCFTANVHPKEYDITLSKEGYITDSSNELIPEAGVGVSYLEPFVLYEVEEIVIDEICIVNFDANGGSVSPESKSFNSGDKLGELPVPVRSGYEFNGWYNNSSFEKEITSDEIIESNQTLYAKWDVIEAPDIITIYPFSYNQIGQGVQTEATLYSTEDEYLGSTYGFSKWTCPVPAGKTPGYVLFDGNMGGYQVGGIYRFTESDIEKFRNSEKIDVRAAVYTGYSGEDFLK